MAENENLFGFRTFDKIPRLTREVIVTEKIDGTNAQILIVKSSERAMAVANGDSPPVAIFYGDAGDPNSVDVYAGSRNRWLDVKNDNYGFAGWVSRNVEELKKLGPGRHYGEWWGNGIQRAYGLKEKRFSLFNTSRWLPVSLNTADAGVIAIGDNILPEQKHTTIACCHVVPTIWRGVFDTTDVDRFIEMLRIEGSFAAIGFKKPEGVVVYHTAAQRYFKKTLEKDESPKSLPELTNPAQLASGVNAANEVHQKRHVSNWDAQNLGFNPVE